MLDVLTSPETLSFVLALSIGSALAGFAAGLFGIGGGSIMVPVLYYVFSALGYPPDAWMHCAVATSSAVIIVSSARSVQSHQAKAAVDWSILWPSKPWQSWGIWFGLGAFIGSAILAQFISSQQHKILFGVVMIVISMQLIWGRPDWKLRDELPDGIAMPTIGASLGALSAIVGIGGGAIVVSFLVMFGKSIHRAIGTAAGIGFFVSIPATIGFTISGYGVAGRPPFSLGYVNLIGFLLMAATTLVVVPLGAKAAHKLNPQPLKIAFGLFLAIVSIHMIVTAIG